MRKTIKVFIVFGLLLSAFTLGYLLRTKNNAPFESLNLEQMQKRVVAERDMGIQKAIKEGKYRCCIKPPCTMCFMEANKWNNFTAGTCACDDLIAKGEEPCPQCQTGLCSGSHEGSCDLN